MFVATTQKLWRILKNWSCVLQTLPNWLTSSSSFFKYTVTFATQTWMKTVVFLFFLSWYLVFPHSTAKNCRRVLNRSNEDRFFFFLMSWGKHLVFSYRYKVNCRFSTGSLIKLRKFLTPGFLRVLISSGFWISQMIFFITVETIIWFSLYSLSIWWITLTFK